jgi:hypothetical protein
MTGCVFLLNLMKHAVEHTQFSSCTGSSTQVFNYRCVCVCSPHLQAAQLLELAAFKAQHVRLCTATCSATSQDHDLSLQCLDGLRLFLVQHRVRVASQRGGCKTNQTIGSLLLVCATLCRMVVLLTVDPGLQSCWVLGLDLIVRSQMLHLYQHFDCYVSLLPLAQIHLQRIENGVRSDRIRAVI